MKKKKIIFMSIYTIAIYLIVGLISLASCTQNSRAKSWGGTAEIVLPKGKKLVTATWKESNLWYLTKDMTEDDIAETYEFKEESGYGVMEGTYRIIEVK
tara:strand:- start:882 stop:1178 length:297 start_codon:yes stop_codon:yes gene_type:complete